MKEEEEVNVESVVLMDQDNDVDVVLPQKDDKKNLSFLFYFVVFGAFLVQFILFGMLNNFGSLKFYLNKDMPNDKTYIDQIGSINYGMIYFCGIFFSPIVNKIGCKYVHIIGCLMSASALLISSFTSHVYPILVLYGLIYGVGASFMYFSTIYVATQYFSDNLTIISGFISDGSCIGTLLQSLLLESIYLKLGWKNVLRMYAGVIGLLSFVALLYYIPEYYNKNATSNSDPKIKTEIKPKDTRKMFSSYVFILKNPKYLLMCISGFIFMIGYLIPIFNMKSFAEDRGVSQMKAGKLVGCYSICSLLGRLLIGYVGNKLPAHQTYFLIAGCLLMGITNILSHFCISFISFIAYVGFLGFCESTFIVLPVPIIKRLFVTKSEKVTEEQTKLDQDYTDKAISIFFFLQSFSICFGILISMVLYKKYENHSIVFSTAGGCLILSSILFSVMKLISIKKSEEIE